MGAIGGNSIIVKEVNTNIVKNALRDERQATKQRLSEKTGLSLVTVGSILQELIVTGEATEEERLPSSGGRPARSYRFNGEYRHVLIIFTHAVRDKDVLFISVVNLYGECVESWEEILDYPDFSVFEKAIEGIWKVYSTISAIGFGMPGVEYNGQITVHDYKSINGFRLTDYFTEKYKVPVVFENDVNAAVMGYCNFHNINCESAAVYLYFPEKYAPGAGICITGKIYKGFSNFAGEIDKIPIGVDWSTMDYSKEEEICNAISKLIHTIICILNPGEIVLSGSFLTEIHIEQIRQICKKSLMDVFMPRVLLSEDFHKDYENGVIKSTLDLLEPKISIHQNENEKIKT